MLDLVRSVSGYLCLFLSYSDGWKSCGELCAEKSDFFSSKRNIHLPMFFLLSIHLYQTISRFIFGCFVCLLVSY